MTPTEAARILELPADATPDQIEARFLELRRRLEDKIAKAPTPGLQAKYRETLTEITTAFETLALAADSSALPVLAREQGPREQGAGNKEQERRPETGDRRPEAAGSGPAPSPLPPAPATRRKSGTEFVLVAIIAVVVLGAGGWFIMKTRAENAEKARIAAEAKAEADRLAAEEKARVEQMTLEVRTQLAEAKIVWEVAEREERDAERRVSELRSELRSLRDPRPQQLAELNLRIDSAQRHANWLRDYLVQHPFRLARARLEELLQARAFTEVAGLGIELQTAREALERDLASSRNGEGTLELATNLPTLLWRVVDPLGREVQAGQGGVRLTGLAFAPHTLELRAPGVGPDRTLQVDVAPGSVNRQELEYDFTAYPVRGITPDTRLTIDGIPVQLPADGKLPTTVGPLEIATRAGYLPAVLELNRDDQVMEAKWIPLTPRGLVDGYLARVPRQHALTQITLLADLETVIAHAGLIDNTRWLELFRTAHEALQKLDHVDSRLRGTLRLINELVFRDEAAARALLPEIADLFEKLDPPARLRLPVSTGLLCALRLDPEAARRIATAYESAQTAANDNSLTLYSYYLYAGFTDEAERVRRDALAAAKPEDRGGVERNFDNYAATAVYRLDYMLPLRRALKLGRIEEFQALARSGIPERGTSSYEIATWLWQDGLPNQALDVLLTRNYGGTTSWLESGVLQTGRIDLLERLVSEMRVEDTFRNGTLSQAAVIAALLGNRTKARQFLEQHDATQKVNLSELGRRALAFELIGDRATSRLQLDEIEKHADLKSGVWLGYLAEAFYALHRQGDAARQRRLLESISKQPEDIATLGQWLRAGAREAAVQQYRKRLGTNTLNNLVTGRYFFLEWLSLPETQGDDVPLAGTFLETEALILAHLTQVTARGRPDAGRWPTPHLQAVPPSMKKRTPFYYPAAATRAGAGKGTAKIRITVGPDGKPRGYETIEATHQAFADELIGKAPAWEFYPALANGKPTTGTYEFTGTFNSN